MQQQRTPVVHDTQAKNFEELKINNPQILDVSTDFYVNTLMIFLAEQIAINVCTYFHTWLERLENKTSIPFITCDSPIVNLTGAEINERHEFYFPLSPTIAVKLCSAYKTSGNGKMYNQYIDVNDEETIRNLNLRVGQEAYKEVFSNNESILHEIGEIIKRNKG